MLQATRHDWQVLYTRAADPWLREMIERSLPPDADDDAVVTVDVLVNTPDALASPDVLTDWVLERAHSFGLASVERQSDVLVEGVTCRREPDGTRSCSIPQRHVHYAPTGFDWSFGGSGPADLALNVLALVFPLAPDATGVALRDGLSVSEAAWELHQEFKYDLIATLPHSGGHITARMIRDWIATHPVVRADPLFSPLERLD
jgi:hypothetical protein